MNEPSPTRRSEIEIAIEEAYGLALEGRPLEALRVLDAVEAIQGRTGQVDLARARCMVRGETPTSQRAEALIESLASSAGPAQWQAQITLARRLQRAGDTSGAARLVKSGLEALRREGPRGVVDPLSTLLSLEVEQLQRPADPPSPTAASSSEPSKRSSFAVTVRSRTSSGRADVEEGAPFPPDDLLALIDLGRRLGGLTDPRDVLGAVLHEAIRMMRADRGFVVLGTEGSDEKDTLEYAAAENLDRSAIDDPSLEVSRSLIRQVSRGGGIELITVADLPDSHPARRSLGVLGVRAVACVPVTGSRGILGVMYLDARKDHSLLAPNRRALLELLASQAAAAVENAQAHREATLALERAEETIQRHHVETERRAAYHDMIGSSPAMQEVYARLDRIVPTTEPVIIHGETGTGKELAAQLIHTRGPRRDHEFVAINCAGLAESLLESELFGHERGAFTGANRSRPGLLEVAHRGTLFLDEIADMPPRMQGDLLRTLQSGEVRRLGGREVLHVDVRVIAASNRDLEKEVERGRFRADLYYRLAVLKLYLPPLRDRADDIVLLVKELMPGLVAVGRVVPRFTDRAMARLVAHAWPGNVRELNNVLRRIAVQGLDVVEEHDLPAELRDAVVPIRPGTLKQAEEQTIRRALVEAGGNKSRAARSLGVDRKTLYVKLRRMGLR